MIETANTRQLPTSPRDAMKIAAPAQVREILEVLRRLPAEDRPEAWWGSFTTEQWPALFRLLDIAADLPRLGESSVLADLDPEVWPELSRVGDALLRLQGLVDRPEVPEIARPAPTFGLDELEGARAELEASHAATVDFLFDSARQRALEEAVGELAREKMGTWGELGRQQAPRLFELIDHALDSAAFRRLTGFNRARDEFTVTLSLQDLDSAGIGWHRDLYWPREWVGEDVFAVLYALDDDSPAKGGAFLYHVPAPNALYALYRRRHQATILWNGRRNLDRIVHAVSRYHTADTSRHLIILQCLRRD